MIAGLRKIKIVGLLLLPGLVVLAPVLFFNRAFADGDAILQLYPGFQFVQDALRGNDSVLWNPHVLTGFVTAASLMGGWLSWLHRLTLQLLPMTDAYAWLTLLYFSLTAYFTYALVRILGLSRESALFAGLTAPWISAYFAWAANMTMTPSFFLLPAMLYFCVRFSRNPWQKNLTTAVIAGVIMGTALHPAHIQTATQTIASALVWALVLDIRNRKLRALPFALLTLAVAGVIAWPQYALFLETKNFSARALQGISWSEAQSGALIPGDLLSLIFPFLSLPKVVGSPGLLYLGAAPLLLLILSWFGKKNPDYKFFYWLFVITTLASIKYSPVLWVVHHLPLFSSFRGLSRLMHVGLFAAVLLAAYGLENIRRGQTLTPRVQTAVRWWWRCSLAALAAFILWSATWGYTGGLVRTFAGQYFENKSQNRQLTLPRQHYYQVIDQLIGNVGRGTTFPNLPVTVSLLSFVAAAGLFVYSKKFTLRQFSFLIIVVSATNLVLVNAGRLHTVSAAQLMTLPPPAQWLQANDRSDFRIFTAFAGFTPFDLLDSPHGYEPVENVALMQNLMNPNLGMLYGIDSIDTYDNLMDNRHSRILAYIGSDRSIEQTGKLTELPITFSEKIQLMLERLPVMAAYNVKYIISAYPLLHSDLKEVLKWKATRYDIPLYMYENIKAQPRYFLAKNPVVSKPLTEEESWRQNQLAAQRGATLIECDSCPKASVGDGTFAVGKITNATYEFAIQTTGMQYFVFGQNFLPGWQATVDGNPTPIFRANYVNQAVAVPAGTHRVIFKFKK